MERDRKVPLVATESQKYGTRQLRPQDKYVASEEDAADMLALGIARRDDEIVTGLSATQAGKAKKSRVKPKRKYVKSGLYKRRDMRAED